MSEVIGGGHTNAVSIARPRALPIWSTVLFSLGFAVALSPNLIHVYGAHNDYEMLLWKNHGLLFHEAEQLFSIARPVAALLSNLTLLPVDTIEGFRWTRIFSVLTVCFLGWQMMSICVRYLRIAPLSAAAIALATFLAPAFIYSVLNAPAWATHLLPITIAFAAYAVLSRSNVQALSFAVAARRCDVRAIVAQMPAYLRLRSVWSACLILLLAFYDFPPNALILAVFPVALVLSSRAPLFYRLLIAARDIGFIVLGVAVYVFTAKALYIPVVRLVTFRNSEAWRHSVVTKFDARVSSSYDYKFNTDPGEMLARLKDVAKVAGDLWFLPQQRFHFYVGAAIVVAVALGLAQWAVARRGRSAFLPMGTSVIVPVGCFLLAASAVLAAGGGFVSYRTIAIPTAITAIVFIFVVCSAVGSLAALIGVPRWSAAAASFATILVIGAAISGNYQMNAQTMHMARNETAYIRHIIGDAVGKGAKAIIIVDPRPFTLPEDHPIAYDRGGRAIPPYELSCFSGYCLQNGAVVVVLAKEMGIEPDKLRVFTARGDEPVPGITCDALAAPGSTYPPGASEGTISTLRFYRSLAPLTCVDYSLRWRDLSVDLSR